MNRHYVKPFAALLAVAVAFGMPTANAATFSINPLRVELDAQHRADVITLRNEGDEPLRIQVRTMHWGAASDGQWKLDPTDDLIVTPELIEIAPGKTAQLRVGTLADAGTSEGTYRLLLNELPGVATPKPGQPAQIRVLTEVSMPVFIEPEQRLRAPTLTSATIDNGVLVVGFGNNGNQRLDPQSVSLTVSDASGHVIAQQAQMANYVLPSSVWLLHMKLPPGSCAHAASVQVSWPKLEGKVVTHPITGAEACAGKS